MADLPMADRHETVLPPAPADLAADLERAVARATPDEQRAALADLLARAPDFVDGWAELAERGRDPIEKYAYARVGYHRGLDALRAHGWGGRGYVRWSKEGNRGFLRCLVRLRDAAAAISEDREVTRIDSFLADLDPEWDDGNFSRA